MGASASISSAVKDVRLSKTQLLESHSASQLLKFFNFDDYCDDHGTISISDLQNIFSNKTDVFLTHDWGMAQFNHKRVAKVNAALKQRGMTTWFDDEQMEGDIKSKMCSGIDHSRVLIVFITKRYLNKVGGNNAEDNCRLEFGYGARRKTAARMLPVVMEAEIRDTSLWDGQVGLVLGGSLYVDLATEDDFDAKVDDIVNRVIKIMGTPLKKIIENIDWTELKLGHGISPIEKAAPVAAVPAPAAAASVVPTSAPAATGDSSSEHAALKAELSKWFINEMKIVPAAADRYAQKLLDAEVGSIDKLTKKLKRNPNFLIENKFDEDDADDIIAKLGVGSSSPAPATPTRPPPASPVVQAEPETEKVTAHNYDNFVTLSGHSGGIWGMIQLADGRICSAGSDNDLRIWNTNMKTTDVVLRGHTNSVVAVFQMNDGLVCSAGMDKMVRVWNIKTGANIKSFAGHNDSVFTLLGLADGRLVSGSADNTLRVWNLTTSHCDLVITGHTDSVQFSLLLWDGTICTASWDTTMRIFDANSGATLKVFRGHTDKLVHVAQISDGRVCSCSLDANIRIWNIRSGACEQVLSGHTLNSRWTVQVMNGQLVSCSRDKTIRFWDLKTGKTVKTLTGHSDYVRCLLLLADDRIVSGSDDHTMRVWG